MRFGLLAVAAVAAAALGAGAGAGAAVTGELRILLVIVDGNEPVPRTLRHYENGQVTNAAWSDVSTLHHYAFERDSSFARLFEEMSFAQLSVGGDTVSVSLPHEASELTWQQWTALALAEAESLGFDSADYDRFLYILPHLPKGAPARGLSQGTTGWCAHISYIDLKCLFHELGHTVGFSHAGELRPDGTISTLGDKSDGLMGSGFNCHTNVVNKQAAGWLGGPRLAVVADAGSRIETLAPQSSSAETLHAIQLVNKGARPGTGVVDTFVSYRDASGFDSQLQVGLPDANGDPIADRVVLHLGRRVGGSEGIYLRSLAQGETYSEHGVTVSADSISGGSATVTVSLDPYDPDPPQLVVAPSSVDAQPQEIHYFTLSITNTSSPSEQSFESHYDASFTPIGPGWIMGWTTGPPVTVPPGETRDIQLLVFSPRTAPPGPYGFDVTVSDLDGDSGPVSAQVSASYCVVGVDGVCPAPGPDPFPDGTATFSDSDFGALETGEQFVHSLLENAHYASEVNVALETGLSGAALAQLVVGPVGGAEPDGGLMPAQSDSDRLESQLLATYFNLLIPTSAGSPLQLDWVLNAEPLDDPVAGGGSVLRTPPAHPVLAALAARDTTLFELILLSVRLLRVTGNQESLEMSGSYEGIPLSIRDLVEILEIINASYGGQVPSGAVIDPG